jgi:hypothetical protein
MWLLRIVVVAALGAGSGPAAAETLTVPPGRTVTANTDLDKDVTYHLILSGKVTESRMYSTGPSSTNHDPIYVAGTSDPSAKLQAQPAGEAYWNGIMGWATPRDGDRQPGTDNPKPSATGRYDVLITGYDGRLAFRIQDGKQCPVNQTCPHYEGSFTVKIVGPGQTAPPRYVVGFQAHEHGLPFSNKPEDDQFAGAQTDIKGKLFFSGRPRRRSIGRAALIGTHVDHFVDGTQTVRFEADTGNNGAFDGDDHRREVAFAVIITEVTREGTFPDKFALEEGTRFAIHLIDDKRGGVDQVMLRRGDFHAHKSQDTGQDTVRVAVGKPQRMKP